MPNVNSLGLRVEWPSTCTHWEIRKGFTLPNYSSRALDRIIEQANNDEFLKSSPLVGSFDRFFNVLYISSCLDAFKIRLNFYKTIFPSSEYRRTSEVFNIKQNENLRIGAFVNQEKPELVFINNGMLFAIEDASQAVIALLDKPLGINIAGGVETLLSLRSLNDINCESFVDYPELSLETDYQSAEKISSGYRPSIIQKSFLCVSRSLSRQIISDHMSTLALLWVISHEDAHQYCGHIKSFQRLGISEQDLLFSEFLSTVSSAENAETRKFAELEADTCATMRAVDYCFECEFLEIITDSIPSDAMDEVWEGRRRSAGLFQRQRVFLLRLISLGSIIPLLVFECSLESTSVNNEQSYPSFITRALNIIFTVMSRAMSVSMSNPERLVGSFEFREFQSFFSQAIDDLWCAHGIMSNLGAATPSKVTPLPESIRDLAPELTMAFLASHGQAHVLGLQGQISQELLTSKNQAVADLICARQQMYIHQIETFLESKRSVNKTRLDKVSEDIQIAKQFISIAKDAYAFL